MQPIEGDLIKHKIGGGTYKVRTVIQVINTSEEYYWRGILVHTEDGTSFPYTITKHIYWEKFWDVVEKSPPSKDWVIGKVYQSTKSGYLWRIMGTLTTNESLRVARVNPITFKTSACISHMTLSFANKYLVPFMTEKEEEPDEGEELFI